MKKDFKIAVRSADCPHQVSLKKVNEAIYRSIDREVSRVRKQNQRNRKCFSSKRELSLCDLDCEFCFHSACGPLVSLSTPLDEAEELTIEDTISDATPSIEEIVEDNAIIEALHIAIAKLDSDGQAICEFIMAGLTEREMATKIGLSQPVIHKKKVRTVNYLREALKDYI